MIPTSESLQLSFTDIQVWVFSLMLILTLTLQPIWYLCLQRSNEIRNTTVTFPLLRAFIWVIECFICPLIKFSSLHLCTWAEFWTSDFLTRLLTLQACNCQVDTRVKYPCSRAFFIVFTPPICTIFKGFSLYLYTWGRILDLWLSHITSLAAGMRSSSGYQC